MLAVMSAIAVLQAHKEVMQGHRDVLCQVKQKAQQDLLQAERRTPQDMLEAEQKAQEDLLVAVRKAWEGEEKRVQGRNMEGATEHSMRYKVTFLK